MNRNAFDDIVLESNAAIDGESLAVEEAKVEVEEEEEENEFVYDRALYDADGLEDEDIDFDD